MEKKDSKARWPESFARLVVRLEGSGSRCFANSKSFAIPVGALFAVGWSVPNLSCWNRLAVINQGLLNRFRPGDGRVAEGQPLIAFVCQGMACVMVPAALATDSTRPALFAACARILNTSCKRRPLPCLACAFVLAPRQIF